MNVTYKRVKHFILLLVLFVTLQAFGIFTHLFEKDFYKDFRYPYDGDIIVSVLQMRENVTPDIKPINSYNYKYIKDCRNKCRMDESAGIRLVYLVKSAPGNFDRRIAIRSSWGYEKRFSDVAIRTVFLLGTVESQTKLQDSINEEFLRFGDIIQGDYNDSYFNNTIKTMMGFKWAVKYCPNAKFYMFVDDDFYVSTKNVLRYIRNPTNYPAYIKDPSNGLRKLIKDRKLLDVYDYELPDNVRLYSGYVFKSAPHRHWISKWAVSLEEYPYHMWPPYVTAGAYLLSKEALLDMYFASYYTKHFRFDDIYVGFLAYKMKIEPFHSDYFHFYKQAYNARDYEFTIASHGYGNHEELLTAWTRQRSLGNA